MQGCVILSVKQSGPRDVQPSASRDELVTTLRENKSAVKEHNTTTAQQVKTRFLKFVDVRGDDECWLWLGGTDGDGYGTFRLGRMQGAHCVMFSLFIAPIPIRQGSDKLFVLHRCDNPPCVNPSHLFLGTNKENIHDALQKGRLHRQKITHCPQGHPYAGRNLIIRRNGHRLCRICVKARKSQSAQRKRNRHAITMFQV